MSRPAVMKRWTPWGEDLEPLCPVCGDGMIADGPIPRQWGCSDMYFCLLDDGVFGEGGWSVIYGPREDETPEHNEWLEHWRVSQVCLVADGAQG